MARRMARVVEGRRACLRTMACAGGILLTGCAAAGSGRERAEDEEREEGEVTPGEDLMQEHGVLERVLLVYDEILRRIEDGEAFDPAVLTSAAGIVRHFVEEYHEKLEEQFVFPRLEAARREVELVAVLRRQHEAGRAVTAEILRLAPSAGATEELAPALRGFARMYRPHAAREDTVLFPAFREVVGEGYAELGEEFEEQEHERLGERGFEEAVAEVAGLEAALGIGDLDAFTPA